MSKSLDDAYALETPEDSVALYRDWATTYDQGFGQALGYVLPQRVAEAFRAEAIADHQPALDIGAGTGLLAEHLGGLTLDAIDISAEMLAVAAEKKLYRNLNRADLTQPLDIPDASYGGFVSSGTFTTGHVGPGCLPELFRIARPGALFALSINAHVFDKAGFGSAFAQHVANGTITPMRFRDVKIYDRDDHPNADDGGLIALFHRL